MARFFFVEYTFGSFPRNEFRSSCWCMQDRQLHGVVRCSTAKPSSSLRTSWPMFISPSRLLAQIHWSSWEWLSHSLSYERSPQLAASSFGFRNSLIAVIRLIISSASSWRVRLNVPRCAPVPLPCEMDRNTCGSRWSSAATVVVRSTGFSTGSTSVSKLGDKRPQRGGDTLRPSWSWGETTDGLQLALQPTTSNSGALFTFAHGPNFKYLATAPRR
jgi:hypothetical protein